MKVAMVVALFCLVAGAMAWHYLSRFIQDRKDKKRLGAMYEHPRVVELDGKGCSLESAGDVSIRLELLHTKTGKGFVSLKYVPTSGDLRDGSDLKFELELQPMIDFNVLKLLEVWAAFCLQIRITGLEKVSDVLCGQPALWEAHRKSESGWNMVWYDPRSGSLHWDGYAFLPDSEQEVLTESVTIRGNAALLVYEASIDEAGRLVLDFSGLDSNSLEFMLEEVFILGLVNELPSDGMAEVVCDGPPHVAIAKLKEAASLYYTEVTVKWKKTEPEPVKAQ